MESKLLHRDEEVRRIGTQLEIARSNQFHDLGETTGETVITADQAASRYPLVKQRVDQLEYQIEHLHDYVNTLEIKCGAFIKDREAIVHVHEEERLNYSQLLEKEKENNETLIKNIKHLERMVSDLDRAANKKSIINII